MFNKKLRREVRSLTSEVQSMRSQMQEFQVQIHELIAAKLLPAIEQKVLPAVEMMGDVDAARNEAALARKVQLLREADLDDLRDKYAELLERYEVIAGGRGKTQSDRDSRE